jgi:AraC-like DNA-binding protein
MTGNHHLSAAEDTHFERYLSRHYGTGVQSLKTSPEARAHLAVCRYRSDKPLFGQVSTPPLEDAFLVTVSLQGHHRQRTGSAPVEAFGANALDIRSLAQDYSAYLCSPFDFLFFRVTRQALDTIAEENGSARIESLKCPTGLPDPITASLGRALLPALGSPSAASAFFVDHVALAINTHLAQAYGGLRVAAPRARGRLSRPQERRAKEFLVRHAGDDISIAAVARECGLSRSYFIKAFKETAGQTPHKWLLEYRVRQAGRMLAEEKVSIAEIAAALGFADQSHLTRVFTRAFGMPPGAWRRENAI